MKLIMLIMLSLGTLNTAFAQNVYSEQFQAIQKIELVEVVLDENGIEQEIVLSESKMPTFLDQVTKDNGVTKVNLGNVLMVTKQLIALGKEIYKIVEAGKPVVTVNSEPIEVLPRDEGGQAIAAMQLHGWQPPVVRKYKIVTKNYLGMKPASFEYMLIFSYGGRNNGQGRYITGAQIKPTNVDVKWGYSLNADFKVQTIMNQGSIENPVAGAVLMIDYTISTVLQNRTESKSFYINGLGQVKSY